MDIEELRRRKKEVSSSSEKTLRNMETIANESFRVAEVAHNSRKILDNLDLEFERQTGLNALEVKVLFFATALQVARWSLLPKLGELIDKNERISDSDGDDIVKESKKSYSDKHSNREMNKSKKGYKSWKEIVFSSVPYDATKGAPALNINMKGRYHRYKTLGHDPILGWIFGTMNIITDTITLNDFKTFNVEKMHFMDETTVVHGLINMFESISEDIYRLPAAVFRQGLHLQSDKYTKQGLPIPILGVFSEELAGKLYRNQYDALCLAKDLKKVGKSAMYAVFINMTISLIHGLFYDETKYHNRDIYEVKTRKILSYSNVIASASNVIVVAIGAAAGAASDNPEMIRKSLKKLDVGGLLVTLHRLMTDTKFIREVKEEFVFGGFNKLIQGEEYNF